MYGLKIFLNQYANITMYPSLKEYFQIESSPELKFEISCLSSPWVTIWGINLNKQNSFLWKEKNQQLLSQEHHPSFPHSVDPGFYLKTPALSTHFKLDPSLPAGLSSSFQPPE